MRPAPPTRLAGWLVLAAVSAGALGAAGGAGRDEMPLFDSRHAPAVLVEARRLTEPPGLDPNRLVRGWSLWRRGGRALWIPGGNARLQLVDLEPRRRRLVFRGQVLSDGREWATVRVDGVERRVELGERFALELPPPAGPGRRLVDLRLEKSGSYALEAVAVEPARTGGSARCRESECRQTGPSIIEAVRRVDPGTRLEGTFIPPLEPGPDQRFEIVASDEAGGERVLFSWRARGRRFVIGRRPFDVEVGRGRRPGWVRLHLRASGSGAAGVWKHLRLGPPLPAPPAPAAPRSPALVVVYVMDAWRADHASHLGGEPGLTPAIDRLAAGGATFRRHLSVAPNTLPATKALFTGKVPRVRGGSGLGRDGGRTLAEAFADAGYRTALFSGNGHVSTRQGTARGFEHVEESVVFGGEGYRRAGPGYNDSAARVHRAALSWLDRHRDAGAPAFLYLHTIHPHTPYDPPPELAARFTRGLDSAIDGGSRTLRQIGQGRYDPTAVERRRLARLYAASVAYNDREIGTLLDELSRRFPPREVLFVLTSDHGEELFDHGGVLHGYTLYDEQLHVPLVVHWPGSVAPATVDVPSDTVDVHDALLALVDPDAASARPGFWQHLRAPAAPGPEPAVQFAAASSVPGGIFAARSERWKLVWAPQVGDAWGMGGGLARTHDWEYLFDLSRGAERVNLAGARDPEVDWLRSRLAAWIETGLARETGGAPAHLDERARQRLRALGYVD